MTDEDAMYDNPLQMPPSVITVLQAEPSDPKQFKRFDAFWSKAEKAVKNLSSKKISSEKEFHHYAGLLFGLVSSTKLSDAFADAIPLVYFLQTQPPEMFLNKTIESNRILA
jgi:hypothetical protein